MKKLFLLTAMSLFIFSGIYGAESFIVNDNSDEDRIENITNQKQIDGKRSVVQSKKIDKKELRKIRKEVRKIYKENNKERSNVDNMVLAGLGLLLIGLLFMFIIHLVGVIIIILGVVLLVYGVLKMFF